MKKTKTKVQKTQLVKASSNNVFRGYNSGAKFSLKMEHGTGNLIRKVTNKHYYIKGKGYCFDVTEMDKYKNVFNHLVIVTSSNKKYVISHDEFFSKSRLINETGKNQYLIPISDLTVVQEQKTVQVRLSLDLHEKVKEKAKQNNNTISKQLELDFK